jgi:hypothetical protein
MSTRSAIGWKTETGWDGVYVHFDGYPTGRGPELWKVLMEKFVLNKGRLGVLNKGDTALQSFVDIYIKGHRGGWSSFPKECYCHSADFVMRDGQKNNEPYMTEKRSDPLFIEWVYVIDVANKKLIIYTHGRAKGEHWEGEKDRRWKQPNYKHYFVCEVDINPDAPEPNWEFIEATGQKISNEMHDKFDKKEVSNVRS